MLLRSGYNTEFSCGAEIWSPNFMTPWKKGEFKKEVREMRERLKKMNESDLTEPQRVFESDSDYADRMNYEEEEIISHYNFPLTPFIPFF